MNFALFREKNYYGKSLVHTYVNNTIGRVLEKYRKIVNVYSYNNIKIYTFSCNKHWCIELFQPTMVIRF